MTYLPLAAIGIPVFTESFSRKWHSQSSSLCVAIAIGMHILPSTFGSAAIFSCVPKPMVKQAVFGHSGIAGAAIDFGASGVSWYLELQADPYIQCFNDYCRSVAANLFTLA